MIVYLIKKKEECAYLPKAYEETYYLEPGYKSVKSAIEKLKDLERQYCENDLKYYKNIKLTEYGLSSVLSIGTAETFISYHIVPIQIED